jgi:hypothetical protein
VWRKWWWGVDANTTTNRNTERRAYLLTLVCLALAVPGAARAISDAATRGPEARAVSMNRPAASLVFEARVSGDSPCRWRVEAGEWTLHDISGLAVGAVAAEMQRGHWGAMVAAGVLTSPVGRESVVSAAVLAAREARVRLAGGISVESVSLHGCRGEFALSVSIDAVVRISPCLLMCSRVGDVRIAGTPLAGADASLGVVAFPAGGLCGVVGLSMTRDGGMACDVSSRVRLARRVRAALGYSDATAAIHASLRAGVRSLVFEAGASVHPVLGVSKAFFISWERRSWDR